MNASPIVYSLTPDEIPRGSSKITPDAGTCGLKEFPGPTLANCTVPISAGLPDHRGNWSNKETGHWEFIEQCGDRYIVTAPGRNGLYCIHDFVHADGSYKNGVKDYNAALFPRCFPIRATGNFEGNCMKMKVLSFSGATRCLLEDDSLEFYNIMIGTQILTRTDEHEY
eukprot:CAMPEP_0172500798 /NCGR_PEP_ID=MMETSP1066-20121228/143114_1 /TAXON_ID=671091 /ORGANISM="Coscinodiscus wailesii, Strain CCMP2513" /LENGTH=167 /DNA_ID=CAMNT_0013275243 /DNA_START=162 /DNA_END=665 /DNA_ORIENTATION=+